MTPRRRVNLRTVAVALAAATVAIQFVPVDRTNPPVVHEVGAPADIATLLRGACYDCHSRQTQWPWYSRVAPVSWIVADHVREGRRKLDFTDWPATNLDAQDDMLREVAKEVGAGEMPLAGYDWVHPQAKLSPQQRAAIVAWAGGPSAEPAGQDNE
jgi:hypothetical protein